MNRDATTSYNPPPFPKCNCRLCHESDHDDTTTISHLLSCQELPPHLMKLRSTSCHQQAKNIGIPPEALQTQSALFLTSHPIDNPDPGHNGSTITYLIGQLLLSTLDDYKKTERYHADLSTLTHNLSSATLKYFKFQPKDDLNHLVYRPGIDTFLHVEDDHLEV